MLSSSEGTLNCDPGSKGKRTRKLKDTGNNGGPEVIHQPGLVRTEVKEEEALMKWAKKWRQKGTGSLTKAEEQP